ncbi:hypothetical protein GY45DRAFT_1328762 [Cubamyces sp. BRFM 1775]|nr:hypothetical protein GY45DRAFT_1328762 [Cubamyces sp. BRFM 1775]
MDASHILALPADIQERIMSFLDAAGILACIEASRQLAELIDSTVSLQYQLELSLAGMVDGPPGGASVRARLEALRACRDAQCCGEHPLYEIVDRGGRSWCFWFLRSAETEIVYIDESHPDRLLTVYRPRSEYCGLAETRETFGGMRALLGAHPGLHMSHVYVDYQQDLMVYSYRTIHTDPEVSRAHCHFASLSDGFNPHPLASRRELTCDHVIPLEESTHISLRVAGDLALWTTSSIAFLSVIVYNWKTGVIVWRMDEDSGLEGNHYNVDVRLISSTALVLIDTAEFFLCLYRFDPTATSDSSTTSADEYVCMLKLPERTSTQLACSVEHCGAYPSESRSIIPAMASFLPDLSLPVLVLKFIWQPQFMVLLEDTPAPVERGELYRLFVPLETLHRFLNGSEDTRSGFMADSSDGILYKFDTETTDDGCVVVPWEDWGPRGTRMVRMKPHSRFFSGLGPIIAMYDGTTVADRRHIGVYEVHPLAATTIPPLGQPCAPLSTAVAPPSSLTPAEGNSASGPVTIDDPLGESYIANSPAWKYPIRTTYPVRKTTRYVPKLSSDGLHFCDIRVAADGLVTVMRRY